MQRFANPARFVAIANAILPWLWGVAALMLAIGLYLAFLASPADYQQGETVRIMYVHVPAAWLSLMIFTIMAAASIVAAVYRHPLADAAAKAAAPLGACFCFLALITGSLWGKPMWGTWWEWDARLTSMFVLMLLYLGYIAVWQAFEEPERAAPVARVVAIVGFINIPIVKFSVDWWNTLHQPASVLRIEGNAIDPSLRWPLYVMALAYILIFTALHLTAIRAEVSARRLRQIQLSDIGGR